MKPKQWIQQKMGNAKSKVKIGSRGKDTGGNESNPLYGSGSQGRGEEYDDVELLLLRRAIKRDPEIFVLNNLMMCVQFFGNYEEEIEHVKETLVSSREAELNKVLPPQKHVLLPDVLQEHVSHNVGFTSTRQTFRPTIEPLQPVRIYMIHDNVDVTEQNYSPHYSSVNDTIVYNMLLKPTEHEGYVQLQLVEDGPLLRKSTKEDDVDLSSIAEDDDDEFCSDGDSVYVPKLNSKMVLRERLKKNALGNSKYEYSRSLPDLNDDETLYEEGIYETRSSHNVKAESDYEPASFTESREKISSREGYKRYQRQIPRSKAQKSSVSHSRASSTSSGYRSSNYAMDSDSSCNTTQNSSLIKSYADGRGENASQEYSYSIGNAELPQRCFKKVTYTGDGKIYDPKEERKQLLNSKQRRIKLALRRHNYDVFYTSSTEFMRHFIHLFVDRYANPLGFEQEDVEDVKREGCVIYCDKVMVSTTSKYSRVEQYEIMPAFWLEWPTCAQEWLDRPRSTWPDYKDVEKIKDFGCYVVPEGFVPKKGSNLIQELEWQLIFPAAERYLETCMTQAQVQVYLIALMLHKTFMRPVFDTMFGLTVAHIRSKLFWMIEENDRPSKWPDNRTGECLLTLLNSLYRSISQNEPTLRDFFVRDRNLFQRVPCEHLLHTQKQLKRIIENPVMYVFHAMENIRHSEKFFPRLDYEMLLKILTVDMLALVNPALEQQISKSMSTSSVEEQFVRDDRYEKTAFWDTVKMQKNQRNIYSTRTVTNKTLINPRKATDSIIEISIRCAELEGARLCALLDFFVRHFIKIAERCHQYRALRQKTVYLDQAERLSILLSEYQRYKDDAKAYRDKIKALRSRNSNLRTQDDPPETPRRNPEAPVFVAPLKDRFVFENVNDKSLSSETKEQPVRAEPVERVNKTTENREVRFHVRDQTLDTTNVTTTTTTTTTTTPSKDVQAASSEEPQKTERVVSLVEDLDDSFLTETQF